MDKYIDVPLTAETASSLKAGDYVYLTGTIYTARDAAHKRMYEALERGEQLPFSMENNVIYYMGPSPAREGRPIGSAGPTTASRMDKYAPTLLDLGEKAMIGKGKRTKEVLDAIVRNKAVYFAAVGGAGALLSNFPGRPAECSRRVQAGLPCVRRHVWSGSARRRRSKAKGRKCR